MKLYGLEIKGIPEAQLRENLQKIDALQLRRIEALKNKLRDYQQKKGMSVQNNVMH